MVLTPQLVMAAASDAYLQATLTKRDEIVGAVCSMFFPTTPMNPKRPRSTTRARRLSASCELG
jgi:hypothetical protein